jgi:hypothetical protein
MTGHAESHVEVDVPLRHSLVRDVTVTGGTLDVVANVRLVIEPHVSHVRELVDALPGEIEPLLFHLGDLLNPRLVGSDHRVTGEARIHIRKPSLWPARDGFVTRFSACQTFFDVDVVGKFEGLLRCIFDPEKISCRSAKRTPRRGKHL